MYEMSFNTVAMCHGTRVSESNDLRDLVVRSYSVLVDSRGPKVDLSGRPVATQRRRMAFDADRLLAASRQIRATYP